MAVVEEARYIGRSLANRWLWLFLAVAALTIAASYQVKQAIVLDIGGPYDCPWLGTSQYCMKVPPESPGWYAGETDPATGITYRWTKSQSEIFLPSLGNQPYSVTLRWAGKPVSQTAPVTLTINAQEFHSILSADYQEQTFSVPRVGRLNADVHITIQSSPFKPANDARRLGVRVDWAKVMPADYGVSTLVVPAVDVTLSLLVTLLIIYLTAWRILLRPSADGQQGEPPPPPTWYVFIAPTIGLLLMLAALLFSRLNLTGFAPQLAVTLLWAGLLFLLVLLFFGTTYPYRHITRDNTSSEAAGEEYAPSPSLLQRGRSIAPPPSPPLWGRGDDAPSPGLPQWGRSQTVALLAAIFALAFALRFGGMVHPQFISSDLVFHAHRIDYILQFFSGQQKNFFFDGQLPNGIHVPYPSAYYLLLAPLEGLFGGSTEAGMLLLRFFSALLDASVTLLLYRFTLGFGSVAALGAAFLYAVGPASFQLFSAGNHSNIFAQTMFVASLVFAVEALGKLKPPNPTQKDQSEQQGAIKHSPTAGMQQAKGVRWALLLYLLFSVLTLLGHYGMFIAAVVVTAAIGLVWLAFAPGKMRILIVPLLGGFALALLIAYLLYYIHFNAQIGGQIGGLLNGSGRRGNGFAPLALLGDIFKWQGWVIIPLALIGIVLLLWGHDADSPSPSGGGREGEKLHLSQRGRLGGGVRRAAGTHPQPLPMGEETATHQFIATRLVLVGWLLACIPLAATALFDRDTIRYNYLALPALCICGGLAMQWLGALPGTISLGDRRYRAGAALVGVVAVAAIVNIVLIWDGLIFNQYH